MRQPLPAERQSPDPAGDDAVRPFHVEALDLRGRAVHMGPALNAMLARHAYPQPVSRLLGEAIVLTALLGSTMKTEGKFILQAQGDGPVDLMVVDYRAPGHVRAYARFDEARLGEVDAGVPGRLLGHGILAMTVDTGVGVNRYQGVVALEGGSLEDAAHGYFTQSEQTPTIVRLAVAEMVVREAGGLRHAWRAGGILAQFLPEAPERMRRPDLPGGDAPDGVAPPPGRSEDDAWVEAKSLLATIEDHELTDPEVSTDRLLYRLFHERGVRVFDAVPIDDECSCSRDRIDRMLRQFSGEEIRDSVEDGRITVTCEFCGVRYTYDPADYREAG
jgi:molecular chaperone Hsp33